MTQSELNNAVARQTGESVNNIAHRGFSLVSDQPDEIEHFEEADDYLLLLTATEEAESFSCPDCDAP